MIDTSQINLLDLISRDTDLKKTASTKGGEYHGTCPFCGGKDRFIVQPNRTSTGGSWSCRNCSQRWRDAIDYVRRRDNCEFNEACKQLGLSLPRKSPFQRRKPLNPRPSRRERPSVPLNSNEGKVALEDDEWQQKARCFCDEANEFLLSKHGSKALAYLHRRGLTDGVIIAAHLGYNPCDRREHWSSMLEKDVWLPRGIVIPWEINEKIWRVNIRRSANGNKSKYMQPAGGANGLYRSDEIELGCTLVMMEGEFNALSLWSHSLAFCFEHNIVPVAIGPATGAQALPWVMGVSLADRVLLAFDADAAGERAAEWWAERLSPIPTVRLRPTKEDVNDMVMLSEDMEAWLTQGLKL